MFPLRHSGLYVDPGQYEELLYGEHGEVGNISIQQICVKNCTKYFVGKKCIVYSGHYTTASLRLRASLSLSPPKGLVLRQAARFSQALELSLHVQQGLKPCMISNACENRAACRKTLLVETGQA